MPDQTILKSVAVVASRVGLYAYNKATPEIGLFAQTIQPLGRNKTQTVEWLDAFPLMRKWIGDRQTTGAFRSSIEVTIEPFEWTTKVDFREIEIDGDRSLMNLQNLGQLVGGQMAEAFTQGRFFFAYAPLRANSITTYDDQNIFDTDHVHPDGTSFSNVFDLSSNSMSRSSSGAPTATEAAAELNAALNLLTANRMKSQANLYEVTKSPLTVVVKSFGVWKGYNDLLTQAIINNVTNTWLGGFRLIMDGSPVSGDEKKVDVILAEPNGPRPAIFMPMQEPGALQTDDKYYFERKEISYGSDAYYGFAAALPQPAVRIQE